MSVPTDVLVFLVSIIWMFLIQYGLVFDSSLFIEGIASFLVLGFSHKSSGSTEILVRSRCANYGVLLL